MLQNRLIIIGKHYKNKIYETSKNKWIIELNGNKLNNWDDFYDIMQKEIDVVTVANINPKKNIEFVVDLAKNNKEFSFVVIGFGPLYSSIKDKIQKF